MPTTIPGPEGQIAHQTYNVISEQRRVRRTSRRIGALGGVRTIDSCVEEVIASIAEKAAVDVDAGVGGREAEGELDGALGEAELAVDGREIGEALAENVSSVVGAIRGGAEA